MNQLKQNLFLTRRDFEEALEEMILPLKQGLFNSEKPGVRLGSSGAVYDEKRDGGIYSSIMGTGTLLDE